MIKTITKEAIEKVCTNLGRELGSIYAKYPVFGDYRVKVSTSLSDNDIIAHFEVANLDFKMDYALTHVKEAFDIDTLGNILHEEFEEDFFGKLNKEMQEHLKSEPNSLDGVMKATINITRIIEAYHSAEDIVYKVCEGSTLRDFGYTEEEIVGYEKDNAELTEFCKEN